MQTKVVVKFYNDLNIHFSIDNTEFHALKISFERFFRSIPSHSHSSNSYEIHYIPYGYGCVTVDKTTYEVVPNTLYVTGPHVEHSQVPDRENPMTEYCVYLKIGKMAEPLGNEGRTSVIALFKNNPFWFGQDCQNIHALMQSIFQELDKQYTGYVTQVETLLQQLIVGMVRNYEEKQPSADHFSPSTINDSSYLIIEESFLYEYQDLTLQKLAGRLGLGPRQTERLLRQHYGKTFLQKKMEAKMSAASILLHDPSVRISTIAETLGYSSAEHFSNAFRRYYHISANKFRKKMEV